MALMAFIGVATAVMGGVMKAASVDMKITELLNDLDVAKKDLTAQIVDAERTRDRELSQSKVTLEQERQRILAEQEDLGGDLAREIQERQEQHELAETQLKADYEITIGNLADRIAAGDAEAQRKVDQIIANRDRFLSQTKDETVLALNARGEQLETTVGRAVEEAALKTGEAEAKVASSALVRSGSPLMALKQVERAAKEEAELEQRQGQYEMRGTALGAKQKVEGAREDAEQSAEDIMAANALSTQDLKDQIERAEMAYTNAIGTEEQDLAQDIAGMEDAADDARRTLDNQLTTAITAARQRNEDINAQTDVLTADYRRSIRDIDRKSRDLAMNRGAAVAAGVFGATTDVLRSAQALYDTLPVA